MVSLALASVQTQREQEILAYRTRGNWQVLRAALDMTGTELYVLCAFSSWAFFSAPTGFFIPWSQLCSVCGLFSFPGRPIFVTLRFKMVQLFLPASGGCAAAASEFPLPRSC